MFTVAETAPTALTSTVSMLAVTLCSSCSQLIPSSQFHQPAHVGILCVEIGGPAGDIGLDLYIQAVEGLHQLRDQQSQRQHQHQHNAQQGDEKAEKMDYFRRGLLFGLAEQAVQPLFQPGHGYVDKKRQNAARQNGQYQIYQLCGKDQNVRKPQQCYKKRYPYHGNEQRLFCFWFHKKSFPGRLWQQAAKKPSAGSFWYCNRKKRACQDEGKGKRNFIKAVCENVGGSFSARKKRGILGQSKFKEIERNTARRKIDHVER